MREKDDPILRLKSRLAQGVLQHQCLARDYRDLRDAAKNGQKPGMVIYHNGTIDPAALFDLPPTKAFCAGEFPLVLRHPDEVGDDTALYPFLAAATYASKVLGVQKQVMVLSNNGPLSPYMRHREKGPLMAPWAGILDQVIEDANAFAARAGVTDLEEKQRLAFLVLLNRNAKILERIAGREVTCCYLDVEKGVLEIYAPGDLADMWRKGSKKKVEDIDLYEGRPQALACSCCDSRAGHGHLYCAQPGEFLDSNVIAAIVPPYKDVLKNRTPHPVWALAEHAYACGVRQAVVTGHSQCGGIKALVEWKAHDESPGKFLDTWVGQAMDVVDEVFAYARKKGFLIDSRGGISGDVYRLTEMRVVQWSARNLEEYFEDRAAERGELLEEGRVLAHYLKIEEREVYVLDPYADIEETYQGMASMKTLESSLPHRLALDSSPAHLRHAGRRREAKRLI